MVKKIGSEGIHFTPKIPKENEILCEECGGIGWLAVEENENSYIKKCNCSNGIIHLCEICHEPMKYVCKNQACIDKIEKERELDRYQKSKKYTLNTCPKEFMDMFYSDMYEKNEGFFENIEELEEYCSNKKIEMPKYVYGTNINEFSLNANDIIELNLEESGYNLNDVSPNSLEVLQTACDEFVLNNICFNMYSVNYKVCIFVYV